MLQSIQKNADTPNDISGPVSLRDILGILSQVNALRTFVSTRIVQSTDLKLSQDFRNLVQCADTIESSLMSWSDTILASRHPQSSESPGSSPGVSSSAAQPDERVVQPPKDIWINKIWLYYLMARILVRTSVWRMATHLFSISESLEPEEQSLVMQQISMSAEILHDLVNEVCNAVSSIDPRTGHNQHPTLGLIHFFHPLLIAQSVPVTPDGQRDFLRGEIYRLAGAINISVGWMERQAETIHA